MAIVSHVDWANGRACYASRETLARRAGVSIGTLRRQLTYLTNADIIGRRQRLTGNAETWLVVSSPSHQAELPLQPESETRTSVMKVTSDPLEKVTSDPLEKVTSDPRPSSLITNPPLTNPVNQSTVTEIDEPQNKPEWFRVLAEAFPEAELSLFDYKVREQGWSASTLYSAARLTAERCKTLAGLPEYFFRACNSESHRARNARDLRHPPPRSSPVQPQEEPGKYSRDFERRTGGRK